MEDPRQPVVLHEGEGKLLQTQVERVVKADGALTEGRLSLTVVTRGPGYAGPPAHRHLRNDEAFFVLEGAFTFRVGDETVDVGPGGFVFVPMGAVHTFVNRGTTPGRMLQIFSPADFEGYFEELAELPASQAPDGERIWVLQDKYGMVVVGPPLGEKDA